MNREPEYLTYKVNHTSPTLSYLYKTSTSFRTKHQMILLPSLENMRNPKSELK